MPIPGTELATRKDSLIQRITDAYVRGDMDISVFEASVSRINGCGDELALASEASSLGLGLSTWLQNERPADRETLELNCVSSSISKDGLWVKAGRYLLGLRSSTAKLDLCAYEGRSGLRLELELLAVSSSVRILVPEGFEVKDHIQSRQSSNVRNSPRVEARGDNCVTLAGSITSSTVSVKYVRPRGKPSSLLGLLFRRRSLGN